MVLLICGFEPYCGGDAEPTVTTTIPQTSGMSSALGTSGSDIPMTGDPTTGVSHTTGHEPLDDHAPCDRYLACLAATSAAALPAAQMGYGEDGTCWDGDAGAAELCREACRTGLAQLHDDNMDEPACTPCGVDGECAIDEVCVMAGVCVAHCDDGQPAGACACREDDDCGPEAACADEMCGPASCGDGVVQQGELCDGQEGCDAGCLGPIECTPLFNFGCADGFRCTLQGNCEEGQGGMGMAGDMCAPSGCDAGFVCHDDTKCHPYCAVGGAPCIDGGTCLASGAEPPLDYLGICF